MLLTIVSCLHVLTITILCHPTDATGIYWSEFVANITDPVGGMFEHKVNMYLFLHAVVDPFWFFGPGLRCDCFLSGQAVDHFDDTYRTITGITGPNRTCLRKTASIQSSVRPLSTGPHFMSVSYTESSGDGCFLDGDILQLRFVYFGDMNLDFSAFSKMDTGSVSMEMAPTATSSPMTRSSTEEHSSTTGTYENTTTVSPASEINQPGSSWTFSTLPETSSDEAGVCDHMIGTIVGMTSKAGCHVQCAMMKCTCYKMSEENGRQVCILFGGI